MRLSTLLCASFLNAAPLLAQTATGVVSGKVVNSVTGQAVKKAVVTLRNATGQSTAVTVSDQSGKFRFDNVQPDRYGASAQAVGYSNNLRGAAKPVVVAAQQEVEDVEVRIPPLAAISGKVVDANGQPMAEVDVMALRYLYTGNGKRLQTVGSVQTDDRGEYRMFDIEPERYYLIAVSYQRIARSAVNAENIHSTVPEEGYAPVFYPGVADISQAPLQEITPGAEWTGANFKLRLSPAFHIRGTVTGAPAGLGRTTVRAQWCAQDETEMPFSVGAASQTSARFDVSGAVPGTYCLTVSTIAPPRGGGVAARKIVTVKGGDIDDIEFTVPAAFTVNGTVTVDGTPPATMPQINIGLNNSDARGTRQGVMKSDGTFQIEGLYPGAYSFFLPQGPLYAKSIFYGSQDVTNGVIPSLQPGVALNITLGTDPGEIDGTVQAGGLESGAPILVVAVPEDAYAARQDMQKLASASVGANFAIANVPPGNYKVFAVETSDFSDVLNRDLTKLLEGSATAVTVTANGHQQVSITAIPRSEVEKARGKLK